MLLADIPSKGSSPLARGTPVASTTEEVLTGLIPARAGNTQEFLELHRRIRAHPRSRGEHWERLRAHLGVSGSSPLARGTPSVQVHKLLGAGLIPARAGNTC